MPPHLPDLLRAANRVLVFTGAGISTECGIPDYRGPKGVWKTRQPVYYQEFMESEDARVEYWDQKASDWEQYRDATPGRVHAACVALERAGKVVAVVTQNIDGLHGKAGTSPALLVEIHGTNAQVECQSCSKRAHPDPCFASFRESRKAPRCDCGGLWKPATISFGQQLKQEELRRAGDAAVSCDLVVALGSTLSVYPAASVPLIAAQRGTPYVVVNRGPTDHDGFEQVTLRLVGDVGELFGAAVDAALG
jgi:NAD-dependent protein deacetylase/lipoamidase